MLKNLFDEAVRIRLRADVPVGCSISRGIGSCAVLGLRRDMSKLKSKCRLPSPNAICMLVPSFTQALGNASQLKRISG